MTDRIYARYGIETPFPVAMAAEVMAGEQSSGTFTRLANETDVLRAAHGARIERIRRARRRRRAVAAVDAARDLRAVQ